MTQAVGLTSRSAKFETGDIERIMNIIRVPS